MIEERFERSGERASERREEGEVNFNSVSRSLWNRSMVSISVERY